MYRASVVLSLLMASFFDHVLLGRLNISGIRPDCMLAVVVSMGVLLGQAEGAVIGCAAGLLVDVLYGRTIGLSAICYMLCGAAGGLFYKKFYADNIFIPAATAGICAFCKENVMAVSARLLGGGFSYLEMLAAYILPCALFTALVCALLHLWFKPALQRQVKKHYERHAGGIR